MKVMRKLRLFPVFGGVFNASKCREAAEAVVDRIQRLKKNKLDKVADMNRKIGFLLQHGEDPVNSTARVWAERVIREQEVLAAYEFIQVFCDSIADRVATMVVEKECPDNLKEGIGSIIFAAKKCSDDIKELATLRNIFKKKYGRRFVSGATNLRPNCRVNPIMSKCFADKTPPTEETLKIIQGIARDYYINGTPTPSGGGGGCGGHHEQVQSSSSEGNSYKQLVKLPEYYDGGVVFECCGEKPLSMENH